MHLAILETPADVVERPLWRLEDLLIQCFQPEELHRLLARSYPAIIPELPAPTASLAQFVHSVVALLERHGLTDPQFFAYLVQYRPLRRSQILSAAQALSLRLAEIEAIVGESAVTRQFRSPFTVEPELVEALEQLCLERERCGLQGPQGEALSADIERIAEQIRTRLAPRQGVRVAGTILECPLASGSFSTVWRSRHEVTGVPMATKIFDLNRLTDGVMLWRFRRSIRALTVLGKERDGRRAIAHLNEVSVDTLAFSMELYTQGSLERVNRRDWSLETKLQIFCDLCRAVAVAHRAGVIHRDIKPANILLDSELRPILIDYDLADFRFLSEQRITIGGLGTPIFAAPEQLECTGQVDERADIYSLGRVLHYLLLERCPGYQVELDPSLANLSHFPLSLAAVVRKATDLDPRNRFADARELLREVEAYKTGWAAFRALARGAHRWARRHSLPLVFLLGAAAVTVNNTVFQQKELPPAVEQATPTPRPAPAIGEHDDRDEMFRQFHEEMARVVQAQVLRMAQEDASYRRLRNTSPAPNPLLRDDLPPRASTTPLPRTSPLSGPEPVHLAPSTPVTPASPDPVSAPDPTPAPAQAVAAGQKSPRSPRSSRASAPRAVGAAAIRTALREISRDLEDCLVLDPDVERRPIMFQVLADLDGAMRPVKFLRGSTKERECIAREIARLAPLPLAAGCEASQTLVAPGTV